MDPTEDIKAEIAIYSDKNGYPGEKIADSDERTITVDDWQAFYLKNPIGLYQGEKYWFVLKSDLSLPVGYHTDTEYKQLSVDFDYEDEFPDEFPSSATQTTKRFSLYVILNNTYSKSFYNPDCILIDGVKYIVASDELGELVLLAVKNNRDIIIEDITLNLYENEGKSFILADKPKIGPVLDNDTYPVMFEGYTIESPIDLDNESYYINSDIYSLKVKLCEDIFASGILGDNNVEAQSIWHVGSLMDAYGPYTCQDDDCIPKSVSLYFYGSGNYNVKYAIYDDDSNYPGDKLAETYEVAVQSETGWIKSYFTTNITLSSGEKYWIVKYCSGSFHPARKSSANIKLVQATSNNGVFPSTFPTGITGIDFEYSIYLEYEKANSPDAYETNSLLNITKTPYESETSPIWLKDITGFDLNMAYVSDKDFNQDGLLEWNIYLGKLNPTSYGIQSIPIFNSTIENGFLNYLDFRNGSLAYDEETYNSDYQVFEKKLWYLELDQ